MNKLSRIVWGIFGGIIAVDIFAFLYAMWLIVVDAIRAALVVAGGSIGVNFPLLAVVIAIGITGFIFMYKVMGENTEEEK